MTSLHVVKSELDGVLVISPPTNYEDFRGSYIEIYNEPLYRDAGINQQFIQDDISTSTRDVLRGMHGDRKTWKLVTCLYGSFYLVVVNNDENSSQYQKWTSFTLSDRNRLQVLIPPSFGNGHLVLSDSAIFHYKQTTEYDRSGQFTIQWNDPSYNFWWPINDPILSVRDMGLN
jgi:dTDP-4-dehydrorhamnose 3,5-epimerase